MKKMVNGFFDAVMIVSLLVLTSCGITGQSPRLQIGDIIFQNMNSSQSKAIQLATHSPYTHVGMVCERDGKQMVFEAVGPVKYTPVEEWIAAGEKGHYVVKRLKPSVKVLSSSDFQKLNAAGEPYVGKPYDFVFGWSDDKIYCSELVWKVYRDALGIEPGQVKQLRDFDLSSAVVKAKLKERYGDNIPLYEKVVSPADVFASDKLDTFFEK